MRLLVIALGVALLAAAPAEGRLKAAGHLKAAAKAGSVRLTWKDRAHGETRYEVRRRGRKVRLRRSRTAWTDRKVAPATTYRYRVRPCRRQALRQEPVGEGDDAREAATQPSREVSLGSATAGGCSIFPPDNPWNTDISQAPVDTSHDYIGSLGSMTLWPDFGGQRAVRHPLGRRAVHTAARPDLLRRRRRVRSRPLPHPARRAGGGRRRPPRDRAARTATASCSSCTPPCARARAGMHTAARPGTCTRTRCARSAGRPPTRPGCRSCPGSRAATRPTPE